VVNLQRIAAESVGRERCVSIKKLAEGGFNWVFLLTMDDGQEVVAKIPFRNAIPARYLTASEVATMDFLRNQLQIPVPKVFAWSFDRDSNPVGVEYIVMEKASGVALGDLWWSLDNKQLLKVITQLVKYEAKLLQTRLSAYGSIYFKENLPVGTNNRLFSIPNEFPQQYCIGLIADQRFWQDNRGSLDIDRGPCKCLPDQTDNRDNIPGLFLIN
jgi:hypothetical protein